MPKIVHVETALAARNHPLRQQIDRVRAAILSVDSGITEEWKWNAPSYSVGGQYLMTFMLRPDDHLHLVVHHPAAPQVDSEILEGSYADGRRMIYLRGDAEVEAKLPELQRVIRELVTRGLPA